MVQPALLNGKEKMYQGILEFPKQFGLGIEAAKHIQFAKLPAISKPENIVICGMGGSGFPGNALFVLKPLDVFNFKNYGLPLQAGKNSLIICVSYSGNTEETLSGFREAAKRGLAVVSISTGGKLEELCQEHNKPFIKIPALPVAPRLALGLQFSALLSVLVEMDLVDKEALEQIRELEINLVSEDFRRIGQEIAARIQTKIPIIYSSTKFKLATRVWKASLNETAKVMAIINVFPELCHNEIVGFWKINEKQIKSDKLYVILLRDQESRPLTLKAMQIVKDMIEREGVAVEVLDIKGKNILEKLFSAILTGYWVSYYLALAYGVDPSANEPIEEFKRRMKE